MFGRSDKATAAAALLGLFATGTGYPIFAYCGGGHGGGMGGHCGGMGCHGGGSFGRSFGSGGHGIWYSGTRDKEAEQAELAKLAALLTRKAEQFTAEHKYARAARYFTQAVARTKGEDQKSVQRSLADCYLQLASADERRPAKQIWFLHEALYYQYENADAQEELRKAIKATGRNPDTFEDRLALGDKAKAGGDVYGEVIEYIEALQIKDDPSVRSQLDEIKAEYGR